MTHPHERARPMPVAAGHRGDAGFTMIEVLLAAVLIVIASGIGILQVVRNSQEVKLSADKSFARQKALSILAELRAFVEGTQTHTADELDEFDDGSTPNPVLTITPDPLSPNGLVAPTHAMSGNTAMRNEWTWYRKIRVRPLGDSHARDIRLVTVRVYKNSPQVAAPGELLAEVSSVIRTLGESYPTTQVYDLYLLALENAPGWWVGMDAIQPFVESALTDLQTRNPGLVFRTHWITKLGFGRDEEYAPYTNSTRTSTDKIPWTYAYPGRMPDGEAVFRYYVPGRFQGRVNVDGTDAPAFHNDYQLPEPFADGNGNGVYDEGETFTDTNGDGVRNPGDTVPYALADMQNHCMRYPQAEARFQARVEAGLDSADTPTWRLLLDRMISDPHAFHNAILVNLHGELLPMPPVRNVSDPAKEPRVRPGWRVVTHPERLCATRVAGNDAASQAPRFRVYAFKSQFLDDEVVTTQREPLVDANGNGVWDAGESFTDWNGNGVWDAGLPISLVLPGGDFAQAPNAASNPSVIVRRLRGGVDADGDGTQDPYQDWGAAPCLPEHFTDTNGDGIRQVAEPFLDLNGNGTYDAGEPFTDLDGDGQWTQTTEPLEDQNGNGVLDRAQPAEPYTDTNGNGRWDAAEPFLDVDGNGTWTAPTTPLVPWIPWTPLLSMTKGDYVLHYGEPYLDANGNGKWDAAEPFQDDNGNKVRDGGFERGEMWFEIRYDPAARRTVLLLHGTPLETPYESSTQRGLQASQRLYDLDYVPCPTPSSSSSTDPFEQDLYTASSSASKNTARWTVELPVSAVRRGYESSPGAGDGDAADRVIAVQTRLGTDLTTGVMWPTRHEPPNLSTTYCYYYADRETIPFSERYQFLGDPRHSPYADTDAQGDSFPNGYNWYFDDFRDGSYDQRSKWVAFDTSRMKDGWMGGRGSASDVPRLLSWLRTALVRSQSLYTTLTGFSYYYMSLGGDVGSDAANGFPDSIPMDGTPFGISGSVHENTLTDNEGSSSLRGSLKVARSNDGSTSGIRSGGYWWAKPWIGELYPDSAYASQWATTGNLVADTGTSPGTYHMVRRGDVTTAQQPRGTTLVDAYGRLADEGCTSVFHVGTSSSTFHHQYEDGGTGKLVDDGPQLASNYAFDIPSTASISRPFGLATSGAGGVGSEFSFTDSYPRFSAEILHRFYDHSSGQIGSGVIRLTEPGTDPSAAYIVVNGIDRTTNTGSAFIARYSVVALVHSFLAAGQPGEPNRIHQVPQVKILHPLMTTELENPASITVRWSTKWTRWDGKPYTQEYPGTFSEDESTLRYVLLYSNDNGATWHNMKDNSLADLGVLPRKADGSVDDARTFQDQTPSGDEAWAWPTPATLIGEGPHLLRIEAYRSSEPLHYAYHVEKFYVDR
jgi:type II secretory pathway pseudopilin PulG